MDGKFPSWTANSEHSHTVADNTPWGYQALDNTNDTSSHPGKVIPEGNYGERWYGDFLNPGPQSLLHKGPVSRMQGMLPEVASSSSSSSSSTYTHNAAMAFSQDYQEIPFGPTHEPIKFSSFTTYQHPSMENFRDVPENYTKRIESLTRNMYNSVNDHLAAPQQQVLKGHNPSTWTSVIKEALEMSNGMELEQDLSTDMCRTQLIYDPPTEDPRSMELKKDHFDCVDNESNVQERKEMSKAQELTFTVFSDAVKLNQDFQQTRVIQYMDGLTDGSSLNDEVLGETSCRTFERCLSTGFYDAIEVCSLAQSKITAETEVSYCTKRPCLSDESSPVISNMYEQSTNLNKHMSYISLSASNSTGNEKDLSVLGQTLQHSSHRTSKERAQSCKNDSAPKCIDSQTKSCTDNTAALHRHLSIASHHLKFVESPVNSSTSDSIQHNLECNLQKGNPSTPTLNSVENAQTPVEDLRTCIESEEVNLPPKREESTSGTCTPIKPDVLKIAAQSGCKVVRKKGHGGVRILDGTSACSQSHSSREISSSDTNNTDSSDKEETDNGQMIIRNIINAGAVSDDPCARYNSQEQSQSLTVCSNPETGVPSVFSLVNTSEENAGSPQTPVLFLEKETCQVERYKDHFNHCVDRERKLDSRCKSPCVKLVSSSTPVTMKKRFGRGFKKKKPVKTENALSTIQESSENITARFRDLKKIKTKAKKIQSQPRNRRKPRCTAIMTRKEEKKLLQNSRAENKKYRRCRKSQKVKHPGLVPDSGQKRCVKSSKMSRYHIGLVFKASSGPQLLGCFEDPLKTEKHHEKQDMPQNSAKAIHSNATNTLLKTPSKYRNEYANRNKAKAHSTELNGDAAFESSLQSTINSTGFQTCITNALYQKVKDERSRNPLLSESVKASDKHLEAVSEKDVGIKNLLAVSLKHSPVQKVDGFTQYCDDHMTKLNKDMCTAADATKSTKMAKKYFNCKYCRRFFRHISAYTIHRRIHTGEKPYRCELCGKNFAQLSKLKSHRNVHFQSASLPCPCCRKKFSEKKDLIAHFTTHVRNSRQNNEPGQEDGKPGASLSVRTHSKSLICNIYNKRFMKSIHKHDRDKLTSCKTCGKEFRKSSQLVVHEKIHWPVKPYACSICAKGFNRIKALKRHSQKHTGEMLFSCSHCDRAFCDLPVLRAHQISKLCKRKQSLNGENGDIDGFLVTHGVDGEVNTPVFFKCQICKQLYQKWCQYILHLQTHTNSPPYLCFACGQSYEKDTEVSFHCRVCCQTSGEEVACGSSLAEILHSERRKCTCLKDSSATDLYSVEASKSQSRSSPGQVHNDSQTLSCLQKDHLTPEFIKASDLPETVHLSNNNQLPLSPTSSGMSCTFLYESRERVHVSPNLWRFKCPRCGQRYKRYRTLCLHMQTHAPAFRYACGRCGRSFQRWNKLWLHQRTHRRKDRRYTCSQCSLEFHFFSSYKMHLLNHADERPYACPLCPQTFAHEEGLHVHQCSFHQPLRKFQCNVCARGFSSLPNLVKHNRLHNGAISHQCLPCSLSFANNKSLQEHLNTHTNSVHLLPSIPSEPLTFLHKCNRCKVSFSTGELLYAHQICHTRDLKSRVHSSQNTESTSVSLGGTQSSTSRSLLSTLDLDAIPKESLFKYPHPDKLYVPPHLSRMSKSIPVINLDSGDEDLPQEASTDSVSPNSRPGPSGQKIPRSSQEHSERVVTHQPQAFEGQESVQSQDIEEVVTDNLLDKASHGSLTQTVEFFETSVSLEGASATVNVSESEIQDEIFECADCSEKLGSLIGLYEHYFLHALGNTHLYRFL